MTAWLDRVLGRVTMYALVIISLGLLAVAAIIGSLLGQISYPVVDILASAAVLLVATFGSNWLIGRLFRIQPQTSSSIITALLLLFIFAPTLEPAGLGTLAIAGVVATATKYLLAVRGRHIFNPAAAGAFIVGLIPPLLGSTFVTWWVGTSFLLPFATIAALAILFRTRKLWLGLVFVAVATLGWGVTFLSNSLAFTDGLTFALLQYPTVFFAGFMLSEPLTLPPRRWQQLLEAAVVGVIFALSFNFFGLFSASPQFALIVGNLLAFFFGQRRGIRLAFVGKRQLAPTSWEFEFAPKAPVRFTPGQFMELTLPHPKTDTRGWRRVFSIASTPGATVRFGIRLPEKSSTFKKALLALEPGTRISATSVGGDFVLPKGDAPLLLVAGGIGITPYISQLEQARSRDTAIVYAISTPDDLAYADLLAKAGCSSVTVVSATKPAKLPKGWKWVEAQRLTGDQLLAAVPDVRSRHTYLSGTPAMVGALKTALRKAGVRRIHTDVFIGY
jgi:ferredoxin-NADP reductase/Na+-transporting NADH:ubiquinone oxidoreductase subunit NqrB